MIEVIILDYAGPSVNIGTVELKNEQDITEAVFEKYSFLKESCCAVMELPKNFVIASIIYLDHV